MFMPLCTVLTTVLATIILGEELHVGSVIGAVAIIVGLYVVLWGKAEDARKAAAPGQLDPEDTLAAPLIADAQNEPN
ncbi:hypothetical protein EJB05_02876 [Eragrostis curvula]|uniref:WAT1-related protein n=1 Tax=Eragrostis curvula TaxID=38414 RepID=A0A5J9WUE1_9POAL|nr:hypothetical protein EJB05_02876 [Eragrostis curvula]